MKTGLLGFVALSALVFGLCSWVTFKVNQRRFSRRNVAGIEEFPNYGRSVVTSAGESLVMFVARSFKWTSLGLGLSAVFMLLR